MNTEETILDHVLISRRVFYPRKTWNHPNLVVDVGGDQIGCHVCFVHRNAGWVLYFHGNGELAYEAEQYCGSLFNGSGVNVCFVEYRGYGCSTGKPALSSMLGDGESVLKALAASPDRVVAFGRSLGSVYAIELAHRFPTLGGLVLESGIASIDDLWRLVDKADEMGCDPSEITAALAKQFDHQAKLKNYLGRQLVLHTAKDHLVERWHAEHLHDWGGGTNKQLVMFERGDHNTIRSENFLEYQQHVDTFLKDAGVSRLK
jgi:hypothetical protein